MQFFFYCLCGGIGVFTDLTIYLIFLNFDFSYQSANIFGYFMGTCVSFILNRKLTFQVSDQILKRFVTFFGVAVIGFLVSGLMLWLLIDIFKFNQGVAKFIVLPLVLIVQYFLNRRVTFLR
jgi:putative flippase GtrA